MTYRLKIDRWQPATINQLLSRHPMTRSRLKRVDENMVVCHCLLYRIPPATGPREVSLLITLGPRQKGADPDSYWKSLLDALVKAKMLIDDNRQYVQCKTPEFERGPERATTITLRDLP